jgi:Dolichyl-phosphate-mannose-protein mannosyltransferase
MTSTAQTTPQTASASGDDWSLKNLAIMSGLTAVAFLVMGYHPGLEDDAFYLAAIKRNLNPVLFPHDADFFRLQFQATIFDKLIAFSVRVIHLPLAWTVLLWQITGIFLVLHACWRISRRCFSDRAAQWAAVTMIAALLTLPVTGTGISLADQYLHPRMLATAAILAAVADVIDRRLWRAGVLLAVAFAVHAIMTVFGISFCAFLLWRQSTRQRSSNLPLAAALVVPLGWLFAPASDAWRQAAASRGFYFLSRWEWYEWLGVFAPLVLLYVFHRWQNSKGAKDNANLSVLVESLLTYGVFQTIASLVVMFVPSLERLRPFEPMRYLHLVYLFFFLIAGGLLGRYVLERRLYCWLLLFVPLSAGMFYAQREMYPATPHVEWPDAEPHNPWLLAFAWIRQSTPPDAYFAIGPRYMTLQGEDYHGFRALAERSVLADYDKDGGMAARVPILAPRWLKEVHAQEGWPHFQVADFQRLHDEFGVTWVLVARSDKSDPSAGLTCPYENQQLRVCRLY